MNGRNILVLTMILSLIPFLVGGAANDDFLPALEEWGAALPLDDRVGRQIALFVEDRDPFGDGYVSTIASGVRRLVFADVATQLADILAGKNSDLIGVTFLEPGFAVEDKRAAEGKSEEKFEKSFVRTEVVARFECEDVTPEEALRIYTSADFRMKVSSRIQNIWMEGDENCVETKGITLILSPMKNCSRIDELHRPGLSAQHSQTVANPDGDDYQPVYFKESIKTFIAVPGGLVLHYINYSRTTGLGGMKKRIARGKLKDSQEKAIRQMEAILAGSTIEPQ